MKRVLLVDDDPIIQKLYQNGLTRQGLTVVVVGDGLTAMKALRTQRPDIVVLDLMIPKFSGVDVLKFMRAQSELANVPCIVLSNAFMNDLASEAAKVGANKALLKAGCTPLVLHAIIMGILEGRDTGEDPSLLLAAPGQAPETAAPVPTPAPRPPTPTEPSTVLLSSEAQTADSAFRGKARDEFVQNSTITSAGLRNAFHALTRAANDTERDLRLQDLYRKVHFVTTTAGLAGIHSVIKFASALEAMLFDMFGKPELLTPSAVRTCGMALDFLESLFARAQDATDTAANPTRILVVDDDPISNRAVISALLRAKLQAESTENPLTALEWLQAKQYDLVLLDVEMPKMNGFELCKRLRALPGYERIPVIYVTGHGDFESRTKSASAGGNDLIAKPIFPLELAVKSVMHLLKRPLRG